MSGSIISDSGGQAGVTMTVIGTTYTTGATIPMGGHKYCAGIIVNSSVTAASWQVIYDLGGAYTLMGVTGGAVAASGQTSFSMGPVVASNAYVQIKSGTAGVTATAYCDWMHEA
jgi:hypothetical protein